VMFSNTLYQQPNYGIIKPVCLKNNFNPYNLHWDQMAFCMPPQSFIQIRDQEVEVYGKFELIFPSTANATRSTRKFGIYLTT
jgi:hypothetical protein